MNQMMSKPGGIVVKGVRLPKGTKVTIGQSKLMSWVESLSNILSGVVIAFTLSQGFSYFAPFIATYLYSGFHWDVGFGSNVIVTITLTVVSIVRSYLWRRAFNKIQIGGKV